MFEITRELFYVKIAPNISTEIQNHFNSFTKALQCIQFTLATLQTEVAAATNNWAQFDFL